MKESKITPRKPASSWLGGFAIVLLTLLVYWPAMTAGFIWDDNSMLIDNIFVKARNGLHYIWFSTNLPDYFPLTSTSLWLEWKLWGMNAKGYHITNIVLHALSALVLWRVLAQLKVPGAIVGAMLFAVHPVNVESVAWIAERKNTLSLLFYLLSLLFFLKSFVAPKAQRTSSSFYWISLAMFVLSLLSKTSGVMLPFVLLLVIWWNNRTIKKTDLWRVLPFFGVAFVLGLVTIWFQYNRAIGGDVFAARTFGEKIAAAGIALWFYLWKLLWPVNLAFVYPMWKINWHSVVSYLPGVSFIGLIFILWKSNRHTARALLFALVYFAVSLFPVLGFFKIYFQRYSPVADHWQYFAMIGIVAVVAAAITKLRHSAGALVHVCTAIAVIAVLSMLSWRECNIYKSAEALWRDTLQKNPASWLAHNNWGYQLEQQGHVAEAIKHYQQSIDEQPEQMEAYNNLGAVYLANGNLEAAMLQFQEALKRQPNATLTHYNIGTVLDHQNKRTEALAEYNEALRLDPFQLNAHNNIACDLAMHGKLDEAIARFRFILNLNPDHVDALNNLGSSLVERGKQAEAVPYLRHATEVKSNNADAHYNLGNALVSLNKADEAITEFRSAIKANPNMALAHLKLANIYFAQRKAVDAATEYAAAVQLQPNLAEAHYQLGVLLPMFKRMDEAVAHLKAAVQLKPQWVEALNNLAWIYATHPNALYRDGDEAIVLSKRAAELTNYKDPAVLDTLGAAHAQNREFREAISASHKAIDLARAANATNLVAQLENRLKLYEAGQPYRDGVK